MTSVPDVQIEFEERGKPEYPEKNLSGVEPGTRWWEPSALATAPSILP